MSNPEALFSKIPRLYGNSHYCVGRATSDNPVERQQAYLDFEANDLFSGSILSSYFYDLKESHSRDLDSLYNIITDSGIWVDLCDNSLHLNIRMGDIVYDQDGKTISDNPISKSKKTFLTKPGRVKDLVSKSLIHAPNIDTIVLVAALHFQGDNLAGKFKSSSEAIEKNFLYFSKLLKVLSSFSIPVKVQDASSVNYVSSIDSHLVTLCLNKNVILDRSKFSDFILSFRNFRKKTCYKNINLLTDGTMNLPLSSNFTPVHYGLQRCGTNYFLRRSFHFAYYYYFVRELCFKKRGISMSDVRIVDVTVNGYHDLVSCIMYFPEGKLPENNKPAQDHQRFSINEVCLLDHIRHHDCSLFSICVHHTDSTISISNSETFVTKLLNFYSRTPVNSICLREPFLHVESNFNNEDALSAKSLEQYMYSDDLKKSIVTRYLSDSNTDDLGEVDLDKAIDRLDSFMVKDLSEIDELLDSVFSKTHGITMDLLVKGVNSLLIVAKDTVTNVDANFKYVLTKEFLDSDVSVHKKPTVNKAKLELSGLTDRAQSVFAEKYKLDIALYDKKINVVT